MEGRYPVSGTAMRGPRLAASRRVVSNMDDIEMDTDAILEDLDPLAEIPLDLLAEDDILEQAGLLVS